MNDTERNGGRESEGLAMTKESGWDRWLMRAGAMVGVISAYSGLTGGVRWWLLGGSLAVMGLVEVPTLFRRSRIWLVERWARRTRRQVALKGAERLAYLLNDLAQCLSSCAVFSVGSVLREIWRDQKHPEDEMVLELERVLGSWCWALQRRLVEAKGGRDWGRVSGLASEVNSFFNSFRSLVEIVNASVEGGPSQHARKQYALLREKHNKIATEAEEWVLQCGGGWEGRQPVYAKLV